MGTLQAKKKQMELEKTMVIFCPQCRKKHPLKECPLDTIEICAICEQSHSTCACPSLLALKAVFQGANEEPDQLYFMGSKKLWWPQSSGLNLGTSQDPFNIII